MDYNRVALFVRVVRAGSFTGAGHSVGLPKSSISRSVSQLETDLGVRLLQRTTRKLALTDAGQAYFDAVQSAVSGLDDADAAVRELGAAPRGRVRIAAPPDSGSFDMATLIARFSRKHPAIRLELSLASRTVDLVAEGFDLAIRAGRLNDSSLVGKRVGETELAVFAAPAYLRRRGRPKTLADLSAHDWVLYRAHDGRATLRLQGPDGERAFEAAGILVADELGFCCAAAEAGAGLVLMPIPAAIDAVRAGRLEHVMPGWTQPGNALWVVTPSARYLPARVAVVRDYLVDALTRKMAARTAGCAKHARRQAA
ncbi:MAG TPA: LysR substrate-binding domain-containing protein [Polyangia bacterium]|jgi:DNA-binding transcriptional LysR family regulator|nr:LysR substrate-binding domain-containing protein [Polyangia bacterium]